MIVTVDIDTSDWEYLRSSIAIGLDYGLRLREIRKSPSRKGYHIIWETHISDLSGIDFYKTEEKDVAMHRMRLAESTGIALRGNKEDVLRVILGDDIYRVIYDIKRRLILPQQVLFKKSQKYRRVST